VANRWGKKRTSPNSETALSYSMHFGKEIARANSTERKRKAVIFTRTAVEEERGEGGAREDAAAPLSLGLKRCVARPSLKRRSSSGGGEICRKSGFLNALFHLCEKKKGKRETFWEEKKGESVRILQNAGRKGLRGRRKRKRCGGGGKKKGGTVEFWELRLDDWQKKEGKGAAIMRGASERGTQGKGAANEVKITLQWSL